MGEEVIRGGRRPDLNNIYFRSGWEANYARYLKFVGIEYRYEPRTFWFHDIKRGSVTYTPDFWLPETEEWVEVKGRMDSKSKTKLRRFREYYPQEFEKLKVVIYDPYTKAKSSRGLMRFLLDALHLPFQKIGSYKQIEQRFSSIIPKWEK